MNNNFNFLNIFEFRKLLKILEAGEKKKLLILFILMIIASFLEMISIGIIIPLINFLINPDAISNNIFSFIAKYSSNLSNLSYINFVILAIFVIYILKNLFLFFYTFFYGKILLELKANIKKRLFQQYLKKDYIFHLNSNSAFLIKNIQMETSILINNFVSPFLLFCLSSLTTFFILILLFYYSFISSLIILFIFGVSAIFLSFFVKQKIKIIGKERQTHDYEMLKNLQQGLSLIKVIKLFAKEKFFLEKFNFHNIAMISLGIKRAVFGVLPKIVFELIFITLSLGSIFYINSINIPFEKFLSILLVYALAAYKIIPALSGLSLASQKIRFGLPALELILNQSEKISENSKNQTNSTNNHFEFNEGIELKDVSFKYSEDQKTILEKINLKIKKNTSIGIVGDNAAGKSTLVNLICGLIEPESGKVLVDHKNISNNVSQWHKLIGFIPQSIYLTDESVQNNIAIGIEEKNIDKEKIKKLIISTGLSKTLVPEDLVGEDGKNISGGQKQKIGIARALYHEPEILIYDEPTSAMDSQSEENLTEIVFDQKKSKTLIIISHKPKVLKHCDLVYEVANKNVSLIDLKDINLNKTR